jgi:DNA-directed RNA polymerase sigma subunit (sigma70/sigma32)
MRNIIRRYIHYNPTYETYKNHEYQDPKEPVKALVELGFIGDAKAQEELVRSYLRFVASVAKSYSNTDNPLEDLVTEETIGHILSRFLA